MTEFQNFINRRHQGAPASQRTALGDQLRVPVKQTKLTRPEQKPPPEKPSHSLITGQALTGRTLHQPGPQSPQASNGHGDGFDTDAEGLDDTTITSLGPDSRNGKSLFSSLAHHRGIGFNPGPGIPFPRNPEQRPSGQRLGQLEAEDLTMEGDEESSDSGDEEGDEIGEEGEEEEGEDLECGEEQVFIDAEVVRQFNPKGFLQYRQRQGRIPEQEMVQEKVAYPSKSNKALRRNEQKTLPNPRTSLASRGHSRDNSSADSNVHQTRSDQQRLQLSSNQSQPIASQGSQHRVMEQPKSTVIPAAANGMTSAQHQPTQLNPTTTHQQASSTLHRRASAVNMHQGTEGVVTNGNVTIDSVGSAMATPEQHNEAFGADRPAHSFDNNIRSYAIHENSFLIPNNDSGPHFAQHPEEAANKLINKASSASLEGIGARKRNRDLDYSLEKLSGMTFEQLKNEAFDHDPGATKALLPPEIANGLLGEKLDYLVRLPGNSAKVPQQEAFFASLPIEQYEVCGDLIVERFAVIISKFKDARQQRRKAVKQFEEEVAKREERVRGKMGVVEQRLGRLKRGGEEVVRGRMAS